MSSFNIIKIGEGGKHIKQATDFQEKRAGKKRLENTWASTLGCVH